MKKSCIVFFLIIICIGILSGSDRDFTQWWIENYGDYALNKGKGDPKVGWASEVFQRIQAAADKGEARLPRFFIIATGGKPYAQAIPDGGIIINPTTLDICYGGVDRAEGDLRMAFILGHELAHLANKDFMHQEAFQTLQEYGEKKAREKLAGYFQLSDPEKAKYFKQQELLADQRGALYAAMVGYDISGLFSGKNNFLRHWARQAGIGFAYDQNPRHPSFEKREQFLRTQLSAVAIQVELFKAGVLLFQVDSFHDSEAAFREFTRVYPAREVLNNIGACFLDLALQHLYLKYKDDYYRFRFSTPIDYSTTAETLRPRGEGDYLKDKEVARFLSKAEEYFRLAVERDSHDRACRCNLAVVSILKKEYARAQAECDFILKNDPRDVNALVNKAIAFYYYGKSEDLDTTQKAIQLLENARKLDPANFEALYNLASLKQARNRMAGARQYWEKYLALPSTPKDNFYSHVYWRLYGEAAPVSARQFTVPAMPAGVRLGEEFSRIEKKWSSGLKKEFKLGNEENSDKENWSISLQVLVKDNIRVIALDGIVELVEQEGVPAEKFEDILRRFGTPQKVVRLSGGNFYVYKERGFSVKEVGGKVSSYTWFEKGF